MIAFIHTPERLPRSPGERLKASACGYPDPNASESRYRTVSKWKCIQSNSPRTAGPRTASLIAIQGNGDHPGFDTHEGHPDPESAGNGLHPMVAGRGPLRTAGLGRSGSHRRGASSTWKP